jgi:hypothetical protein
MAHVDRLDYKPTTAEDTTMRTTWPLLLIATLVAALAGLTPASAQPSQTFTLKPTGSATITFIAFCTEFGDKYPDQLQLPSELAKPEVRSALQYIADNGLARDTTRALQGQYAIWNLLGQSAPTGGAIAQQVVTYGRATPVSDPQGTSLLDAAKAGQVRLTLQSWNPASAEVQITNTARDYFFGRGRLLVENVSDQPLTLYMPVGTLFHPTVQSHQTMAAYLAEVAVIDPNLPETSGGGAFIVASAALLAGVGLVRLARLARGRRVAI